VLAPVGIDPNQDPISIEICFMKTVNDLLVFLHLAIVPNFAALPTRFAAAAVSLPLSIFPERDSSKGQAKVKSINALDPLSG
jgi:hypothetical protein